MYKTSRDYEKMINMLEENLHIICYVNYDLGKDRPACRDICKAMLAKNTLTFVSRGICYAQIDRNEDIFKKCKLLDVEWVMPH